MKLEEINALWLTATRPPWEAGHPLDPGVYSLRQPELECWLPQDLNDSKTAAALFNAWPALYRELLAARELRDSFAFIPGSFRKVEFENLVTTSQTIPNVQAYDAARKETDTP